MSDIRKQAEQFFDACETGKGWETCAVFCHPGATFSAQAGALAQADLLRRTIETLRRLKYRPTGGFCAFYLADPGPAGGFGVLDSDRRAKPALQALTDACRPVILVGEPLPASIGVGRYLIFRSVSMVVRSTSAWA